MSFRSRLSGAVAAGFCTYASGVSAQPPALGHTPELAVTSLRSQDGARLQVASPSMQSGGDIARDNTQYGANRFPGASWTPGPRGTRSYVLIIQGRDHAGSTGGPTSIHLTLYNIPASITHLPAGMTAPPLGAVYGPNVHGLHAAYAGPHTHTAARHEYHLQVLALDTLLPAAGDPSFETLSQAMAGHVLASGDLVAFAAKPADLVDKAPGPVRVDTGLLQGAPGRDAAITVYKGVPYAAPPVGALRWRAPQPAASWTGVRQANAFGAVCPQPTRQMIPADADMSEDCLTLNVWTGARSPAEKRPVYVWIYGGGFIGGTGSSPEFDGEGLARKGVIVVTFNYRVGALGFLSTPALSRESGHDASGDYGIEDDIAALKWVKRNIAAFGGDPSKVTIGGQSAGAGSVGFLSISPLAKGLFRASIAESHARYPRDPNLRFLAVSYRTREEAEHEGVAYATAHGAATLEQLRALPWQDVIKGSDTIDPHVQTGSDGEPPLFRPVIDGYVIPHGYAAAYAAGAQNPVTFVAGNNKDETGAVPETAFAGLRVANGPPRAGMPQTDVTLTGFVASARRKFGPLADDFLKLYPAHDDQEAALQNNAASRDDSRVSTYLWGTLWTRHATAPVFTYAWTHAPPGSTHDTRGAYHGSEINYAFDNLYATPRPWTDTDRAIADAMSSYWANIIKKGDPNGPGLTFWPPYDPDRPQVMELGDRFGAIPVATPDKLAFWKRFYATQTAW